jgi:hemerythrin-like domain-containing protein
MTNVFDALSSDHEELKRMLAALRTRPSLLAATGADVQQFSHRKKRVEELIIAVSRHEAAEAIWFWPVVRERNPTGDDLADKAILQEQEGKNALDLLDQMDPAQPEFEDVLASFLRSAREHIFLEETVIWPALAVVLSMQEANELGQKLEQGKRNATTRPHPASDRRRP